jgi:hypothetical protein
MSIDDPIDRRFVGLEWEDHLFQVDNQKRGLAASWKIMRSPQYMALADGSWRLRAVGIPLWLAGGSLQGDIDILLGRWSGPPGSDVHKTIYRAFELKTSKVARDGKVTSLKAGKFHKTLAQLGKLWDLGMSEVFLLDAFIMQVGYSNDWSGVPPSVAAEVKSRIRAFEGRPQGYIAMGLEQVEEVPGDMAGVAWPVATMKPSSSQPLSGAMKLIVAIVEDFQRKVGGFTMQQVISYCYSCRQLTAVEAKGPYTCGHCSAALT